MTGDPRWVPFVQELKRRGVFRAAGVYLVAAWAVVEATDTLFPHLGLPDWSIRLVIGMALVGFPLAIVLSWVYDLRPAGGVQSGANAPTSPRGSGPRRAGVIYVGGLLALATGAVALSLLGGRTPGPSPVTASDRSIGVLPFVNMSADAENEYFSDGLTEELMNALAQVRGLRVAARTSSFAFKGRNDDVSEIAQKLRVGTVLEGSVRRTGTSLRITAQLIDASTGYHLWSDTYDRELEDIFAIQEEIARSIVETLTGTLLGEHSAALPRRPTGSVEAYDHYLRGRHALGLFGEENIRRSMADFERALAADPTFARAHAGLAIAYIYLAEVVEPDKVLPRAKAAALKALELDSALVETRLALAEIRLRYDWDWGAAEAEIRRAAALDPQDPRPRFAYAAFLQISRRFTEAERVLEEGLRLESLRATDPDAFRKLARRSRARQAYLAGDYEVAIRAFREAQAEQPSSYSMPWLLGLSYLAAGSSDSAIVALERADSLFEGTYPVRTHLGVAYAYSGRRAEAEVILRDLLSYSEEQYVPKDQLGALYFALGETATALIWMEQAFEEHHWWLPELNNVPFLEDLRNQPEFRALLRRINAPEVP
jgi:adenylate cyclase